MEWSTPHLPPFSSNAQLRVLCNASTLASSSASTRGLLWPHTHQSDASISACAISALAMICSSITLVHRAQQGGRSSTACVECLTRPSIDRRGQVRATLPSSVPQHICLVALVIAANSRTCGHTGSEAGTSARVPQCAVLFVVVHIGYPQEKVHRPVPPNALGLNCSSTTHLSHTPAHWAAGAHARAVCGKLYNTHVN